jgi:hypothetical protein
VVRDALSNLFLEPNGQALLRAYDAVDDAILAVQTETAHTEDVLKAEHARRILASLHLFRTVLLDDAIPVRDRIR